MKRSARTAPTHAHRSSRETSLLLAVMLLACLSPLVIAIAASTAKGQEQPVQPVAAASSPAEVPRGWIEPLPATATTPPTAQPTATSEANRPATLRLPATQPRPLLPGAGRIPDLPTAAEFDSRLVGSFTSGIQPLLLNRCAAGKCHGGSDTAAPQLRRQSLRGNISREMTLANIEALTGTVLPDYDPRRLLGPASIPHGGGTQPPLTQPQLQRLAIWLDAALAQRATWGRVEQASFESPVPAPARTAAPPTAAGNAPATLETNRFQQMLNDAANPEPLPPPQEPQGLIPLEDLPEAQPQG